MPVARPAIAMPVGASAIVTGAVAGARHLVGHHQRVPAGAEVEVESAVDVVEVAAQVVGLAVDADVGQVRHVDPVVCRR